MESITYNSVVKVFSFIKFMIAIGLIASCLMDIQKKAFGSLKTGLVSMKAVNEQLVGKTK